MQQIKAGLDILFEPGQTFEIRAIRGKKIGAGFFRDTSIAAEWIKRVDQTAVYAGIYCTINPVNPDLYYRRMDRIDTVYGDIELTGNNDIIKRRWLIIDLDPKRPSGISASDEEKQLAFDLIPFVEEYLTSLGFPIPIIADSGNGFHLLYRVDLPTDSNIVKDVLTALSKRVSSGICKVDVGVANAGRIMKVYGTMSRKGDTSDVRPHRRSAILSIPDEIIVVPKDILELVSPPAEVKENLKIEEKKTTTFKEAWEYLDEWGLGYEQPKHEGNECIYRLEKCPFSEEHTDGAYVSQNVNTGALTAKCFHDSCGGGTVNRWKELRDKYDSFYSGNLQVIPVSFEKEQETTKYLKLDTRLSRDNFIVRYMEYWKTRTDAYPEYHHASALTLLSIIANRKLVYKLSSANIYTNIWSMCLGKSSISRKSTAISKTELILKSGDWIKPFHSYPGMFSSEGLIEEMHYEPKGYIIMDECSQLLLSINTKKYLSDLRDVLCKLYDGVGTRRKLKTAKGKIAEFKVEDPYATFLFATTHETFMKSATGVDISSGWLIRFLYYYPEYKKDTMGIHDATGDEDIKLGDLNNEFWKMADLMRQYEEVRLTLTPFGFEYFNKWIADSEEELLESGIHGSVFQRYAMYSLKLAALYYIAEPGIIESFPTNDTKIRIIIPDPYIIEAIREINEYFLPVSRIVIGDVNDATSDNLQNKIIMTIRGEPNRAITKSKLLRIMRKSAREVNEALTTLALAESVIIHEETGQGSKKCTTYIMLSNIH